MKEKLMELCKNKEFAEKFNSLKTEEEVIACLKDNGIEVNSIEELKALMQPESGELDVDELNQAAGGMICAVIGFGAGYGACWNSGKGDTDMNPEYNGGIGTGACIIVGIGIGLV